MQIAVCLACLVAVALFGEATGLRDPQQFSSEKHDVHKDQDSLAGIEDKPLINEPQHGSIDGGNLSYAIQESPRERRRRKSLCTRRRAGRCVKRRKRCPGRLPCQLQPGRPYCGKHHRCCYPDTDECLTNKGGCEQICTNTVCSFFCSCEDGYSLNTDDRSCLDIDECLTSKGGCNTTCTNNEGSFDCSCDDHYILDTDMTSCLIECVNGDRTSFNTCECAAGWDGTYCENDVDECLTNKGGCDTTCTNNEGSFDCSCDDHYTLDNDMASCLIECVNGDRTSFNTCECQPGWDGTYCENDVNECNTGKGGCEQDCQNTPGSFYCTCRNYFTLQPDKFTCLIECINGGILTSDDTTCECPVTWTGGHCEIDVNECNFDNGGCEQKCVNTWGSRDCACNTYHTLTIDSVTCEIGCVNGHRSSRLTCECPEDWAGNACEYGACDKNVQIGSQILSFSCQNNQKLSWSDAENACMQIGGKLAKVGDFTALWHYTLEHFPEDSFWLGANDYENEGTWLWADGSSVDAGLVESFIYNNDADYPNFDCMQLQLEYDALYDHDCGTMARYICEHGTN